MTWGERNLEAEIKEREKKPCYSEKWRELNEASEWGMESVLDKAAAWTKFC